MATKESLVFSIFSCGCKQYKSIHINSGDKGNHFSDSRFAACYFFHFLGTRLRESGYRLG